MSNDRSEGWEDVAERFMATRSDIGARLVQAWARTTLPLHASIVDIGCGSGVPITQALIDAGFQVCGIDAAPTLIAAFHHRFPHAPYACEAAQDSAFFHRAFDAAVSVGLIFLLDEDAQHAVIRRIAGALVPGGHFLFSAPREMCDWQDSLTGRRSLSLGAQAYERGLHESGLRPVGSHIDEGGNHYYEAVKPD